MREVQPSYSGLSIEDDNDVWEIIAAVERHAIPTLTAQKVKKVPVKNRSTLLKPGNMIAWQGERFADGIVYPTRSRGKEFGGYKKYVLQADQLTRIHIPCEFNGLPGLIVLYETDPPKLYPRASQLLPNLRSVQAYITEHCQGHIEGPDLNGNSLQDDHDVLPTVNASFRHYEIHESQRCAASSGNKRPSLGDHGKSGHRKRRILSGSAAASSSNPDSASASGYECLTQEPEESDAPGNATIGADQSQMNGNLSIQSYNHVPLLESSSMKSLTEQVLLMMTDYATTSCTSMDKVWGIVKRYMEEQISPISPVSPHGCDVEDIQPPPSVSNTSLPVPPLDSLQIDHAVCNDATDSEPMIGDSGRGNQLLAKVPAPHPYTQYNCSKKLMFVEGSEIEGTG